MLRNPIITTPLGPPPPPPPLSLSTSHGRTRAPHHSFPAYAGARHTLGPTFSEEEDGDDSEFIAEKMAKLGLGKYGQGPGQAQAQDRQNEFDRRTNTPLSQSSGHSRSRRRNQNNHNQNHNPNQYPSQNPPPPMRYATGNGRDQNVSPFEYKLQGHAQSHSNYTSQAQQAAAIRLFQEQAQQQLLLAAMAQSQSHLQSGRGFSQQDIQRLQQIQTKEYQQQSQKPNQQTPRYQPSPHSQTQSQPQMSAQSHTKAQDSSQAFVSASDQRSQLAAQVHANLAARNRRQQAAPVSESEIRARFESIPDGDALRSPFTATARAEISPAVRLPSLPFVAQNSTWAYKDSRTSDSPQVAQVPAKPAASGTFGRFSHAPSQSISAGSSLSTLLTRRAQAQVPVATSAEEEPSSTAPTTAKTSPTTSTTPEAEKVETQNVVQTPHQGTQIQANLGLGRPRTAVSTLAGAVHRPVRAWSSPAASGLLQTPSTIAPTGQTPRSISQPSATIHPSRQPYGPPGNMDKLKEENFKSLIRKRAGLKLGMLNRRVSPSTPITALPDTEGVVEE